MALGLDKLEPLAYLKHETEEMTFGKRKKKHFSSYKHQILLVSSVLML